MITSTLSEGSNKRIYNQEIPQIGRTKRSDFGPNNRMQIRVRTDLRHARIKFYSTGCFEEHKRGASQTGSSSNPWLPFFSHPGPTPSVPGR
mmetsp:Transcript_47061/g.47515  ORF Transcript_47061/g.47515 Transcript_47061/m.47515 type:complete len:91 (+) Transcript_47061:150-422(+)